MQENLDFVRTKLSETLNVWGIDSIRVLVQKLG
jgi:hypothetical protein